jgi:hypothetical protein
MIVPRIFPRRRNADGSYDSICPACFLTAAHAAAEEGLATQESTHVCHWSLMSQWGTMSHAQCDLPPIPAARP